MFESFFHVVVLLQNLVTNFHIQARVNSYLLNWQVNEDVGEAFVKSTFKLEGDGPLALECYESVQCAI